MTTDGQTVEPFTYQGRTYVPLNAVATALGQKVIWDGGTKSIYIGSAPSTGSTTSETVLMDKNSVKITYLGIGKSDSFLGGSQIKLKIENNSSKNYTAQVRNLSINGIMCDSIFSCDVASGKTAIDGILIYESALEEISQTSISNAEFSFHIFNNDDWQDSFDSSTITI